MKATLKTLLILALAVSLNTELQAQGLKMPQASSGQSYHPELRSGQISINYSRPNTKGRKIFGGLEPYGSVWRTGANSATLINFTEPVKFGGTELPAGEYGLFYNSRTR